MTRLEWWNFWIVQFLCVRVARYIEDDEQVAWGIIGPVLPFTGWGCAYAPREYYGVALWRLQ